MKVVTEAQRLGLDAWAAATTGCIDAMGSPCRAGPDTESAAFSKVCMWGGLQRSQGLTCVCHTAQFQLKVVAGGSAFGAACIAAATTGYMRSIGSPLGSPRGQGQKLKFPPRGPSTGSLQSLTSRMSLDGGRRSIDGRLSSDG